MPWELDGNPNIGGNQFLGTRQNDPLSIRTRANVNNNSVVHITPAPDANTLGNVGIGTTQPRQRLALGSGNVLLPHANLGIDGNLYFGGITDVGQTGMRLFGGLVNTSIPAGFVDVRTTNPNDGLRIRVDTGNGGTERMRVTASGNVGIGTGNPLVRLHALGNRIRIDNGAGRSLDLRADGAALDLESNGGELFINNNNVPVRIRNLQGGSSRALKENILDFTVKEAIQALDGLEPILFNWKDDEEKTKHLGFVAEDTPEIATSSDKTAIIPMHILAILSKVVKEQQRTINSMRREFGQQTAT